MHAASSSSMSDLKYFFRRVPKLGKLWYSPKKHVKSDIEEELESYVCDLPECPREICTSALTNTMVFVPKVRIDLFFYECKVDDSQ